jgi:hypothetical protein
MSTQPAPSKKEFKPFSPEERASFLAHRFGSQLDWASRILVEINYPVETARWFVDAVCGVCKGKPRRIAHATLATRAQRYRNPSQAKSLVKRAIEADREWSRTTRRMVFDIEMPKPHERDGAGKRERTLYTDYLTAAAVFAQESQEREKKANELRWKRDSKFRFEARAKILAEAVAMLPSFERVEDMPQTAQPKEKQPLSISEYVEQREAILLAEKRRILDRLTDGDLVEVEEIDERIATLEASRRRVLHEVERDYASTLEVLRGLKKTRCVRAMSFIDPEEIAAEVDAMIETKGYAGDPLSRDEKDAPAEWLREVVEPETKGIAGDPLSTSPLSGNNSYKGVAGDPLSFVSEDVPEGFEEVLIGDEAEETPAAHTQLDCALSYAAIGLPVFPTKPEKTPYTAGGFKAATTDEAAIRAWWAKFPDAGIGIPTGRASGWLVLDVDPRHGGDASLSALAEQIGGLPQTQQAKTPSNGDHFIFKNSAHVEIRNSAGKLGKGLDIRGEGGYIVAPGADPSRRWCNALDPAEFPEQLIEILTSETHAPIDTDRKVLPFTGGTRFYGEGERNEGLRNLACGWWRHGHVADESELYQRLLDARSTRCAPGKDLPATDAELRDLARRTARKYAHADLVKEGARA